MELDEDAITAVRGATVENKKEKMIDKWTMYLKIRAAFLTASRAQKYMKILPQQNVTSSRSKLASFDFTKFGI